MVHAAAAADGFIQVRTLHKELVLKTFHAQVGVELKEYELEKLKKKSNSKVALRPMLKVVAGKRGKPDSKKKPAPAKKSATNESATNKSATKKTTPAST
jgi:hypothetical protein